MSKTKLRIRRDDTVVVIAGKDKGSVGRVLRVNPDAGRVIVEGVRRVKRHKRGVDGQQGSIVEMEAPVHVSNVALWNAAEKRRVKVAYKNVDGKKIRVDRKTGAAIDKA